MAPGPVLLGLAGDLVSEADAVDYSATRIGGQPVFPGSSPPADCCSRLVCSVCGRRLSLVLQAYAPHPAASERALMLFGCTALGCGKSAGCWAALRCQLPPQSQQQQQGAAEQQLPEASRPVADAAAPAAAGFDAPGLDDWGLTGLDDWGQAAAADAADAPAAAAAAFDFSALTSSLEAAGQQQQQQAAAAAAPGSKHKAGKQDAVAAEPQQLESCRGSAGPPLPEFYLYAAAEPDGAASKAISSKELAHVQQLLAAYQAEAAGAASASASATEHGSSSSRHQPPAPAAAAAASAAPGADREGGDGSWGGEEYEADAVRGVESAYLKFSKRLARQPDQCARYSLGGPLLWPKPQPPQPSRCPRCGGPRAFELQLMPPLIQLAIEAAQMMLELQQQPNAAVVDAVANWDWVTVAVFTCEASCSSSSGGGGRAAAASSGSGAACEVWLEELQLINEADCHTALPAPLPAAAAAAVPAVAPPAAGGAGAGEDDGADDDADDDAFDEDERSV